MYAAYWGPLPHGKPSPGNQGKPKGGHGKPDRSRYVADLDLTHLIPAMDLKEGGKGLIVKLQEAAAFYSMSPIKGIQVGGLSDAGLAASLGIPTLCGMGVIGSGAHTDEEKALVSSLFERSVLAAALLHLL